MLSNIKTREKNGYTNVSENLRIVACINIAQVNSIRITKSINLQLSTLILYGVGVSGYRSRVSVLSQLIREVNDILYDNCTLVY